MIDLLTFTGAIIALIGIIALALATFIYYY